MGRAGDCRRHFRQQSLNQRELLFDSLAKREGVCAMALHFFRPAPRFEDLTQEVSFIGMC